MSSQIDTQDVKFDVQEVIDKTGLDLEDYLEIYELFQENFNELMIELRDEGYVARGTEADLAMQLARSEIQAALEEAPKGLTYDQIEERTEDVSRTTIKRVVAEMMGDEIHKTGTGKKGDPFRFAFRPIGDMGLDGNQTCRFEDSPSPDITLPESLLSVRTPAPSGPNGNPNQSDLTSEAVAIFWEMVQ